MNEIKAIEAKIRRNRDDRLADLKARGLAPRPTAASWIVGCEVFSVCLRPLGAGRVGIDVSAGRRSAGGRIWGEDAPGPDIEVDAAALLAGLTAAWPIISRPFRRGGPVYAPGPREEADWAALSGLRELPTLRFVADGPGLRLETAAWTFDPGPECLIVVEALMTVGDLLKEMAGGPEAAAWRRSRELADVLPFRPLSPNGEDGGVDADEVAYYAARLGTDVDRRRGHMLAWAVALRDAVLI